MAIKELKNMRFYHTDHQEWKSEPWTVLVKNYEKNIGIYYWGISLSPSGMWHTVEYDVPLNVKPFKFIKHEDVPENIRKYALNVLGDQSR